MPVSIQIQQRVTDRMDVRHMGYSTPCWISNRVAQPNGYTKMAAYGRTQLTHRVAYEAWHGDIPKGLVIDHLCRVRQCCNPAHLEAVTNRENLLRGDTLTSMEIKQTACKHGHPFDEANTYMRPDRPGRVCRACSANRAAAGRRSHQ